jgi:O-antigen ligase
MVAAILLSLSRSAVLILAVMVYCFLILQLRKRLAVVMVIFSTAVIVLTGIISTQISGSLIWTEFYQPTQPLWLKKNAPEKRTYIWNQVIQYSLEKPSFGYGLENLQMIEQKNKPTGLIINRSDNYYLDLLFFSGVYGLGYWIFLMILLFKNFKSPILKIMLVIYLIWSFFEVQSVVQLIFVWWLIGISDIDNTERLLNTEIKWTLRK